MHHDCTGTHFQFDSFWPLKTWLWHSTLSTRLICCIVNSYYCQEWIRSYEDTISRITLTFRNQ
jgi:hypothetical protein